MLTMYKQNTQQASLEVLPTAGALTVPSAAPVDTTLIIPSSAPAEAALILPEQDKPTFETVVSHKTVATAAGIMSTTVGAPVGALMGRAVGYELGEKVAETVRESVKEKGDEIAQAILQGSGLDGVPGASYLVQANVTGLAHQAGEMAYNETVKVSTAKGATIGGLVAGGATVAFLEGLNLIGYAYRRWISPSVQQSGEDRLRALAAQMDAEEEMLTIKDHSQPSSSPRPQ
ncbi:hypothetical protein [Candidatus Berkiella aquae]|uniref:Uncharacterized protein n=1 Tax=Candidatus Berkiella aquae TaxID=295108 RepID=A0A0Q9YXS4_9GAMM|nr:hypothetical protein [Candidatus Berkiella aquae]MCS5712073.1 hypothetical protein [Candidatus Berkiella aquae]